MSDQPYSDAPQPGIDVPPAHVRLVLTVVLDGPGGRGDISWHVRDVDTGATLLTARWPIAGDRFGHDYTASRALKAISDVWACCGPF